MDSTPLTSKRKSPGPSRHQNGNATLMRSDTMETYNTVKSGSSVPPLTQQSTLSRIDAHVPPPDAQSGGLSGASGATSEIFPNGSNQKFEEKEREKKLDEITVDSFPEPALSLHEQDLSDQAKSIQTGAINGAVGRQVRSGTWAIRYDQHLEEQKVIQHALKKSRQQNVKHAVKFLLAQVSM